MSDFKTTSEQLPLASFQIVDLHKLMQNDTVEQQKLLSAAKLEGFFYLSFENIPERNGFESLLERIYDLEKQLFSLSEEEKLEFDVDKQGPMKLNGYIFSHKAR